MNEGAFGHIVRKKPEGPSYEELFVAMERMLKRVLQHLVGLEGSREEVKADIRSLLEMVIPIAEAMTEAKYTDKGPKFH